MFAWYLDQKEKDLTPNSAEFMEKAREFNLKIHENEELWRPSKSWLVGFKERYGIPKYQQQAQPLDEEEVLEKDSFQIALESANFLLEFIDSHNFPLKDVITVRMIRDKIANENLN